MKLLEQMQPKIQDDPTLFFDNVLECGHWSMQDTIVKSIFENQRTTVRSCHGSGKSYIAARAGLAYLFAYPNSVVLTTAPTWRQVEDIIWREINRAVSLSEGRLGGQPLKTRFEISPKWYAKGISSDKSDNVQGYHARHILIICDEAAGIPTAILQAIEGLLTSANVRLLYIGNPTTGLGPFYDSHKSSFFHKIKISVFDTPNFTFNNIKDTEDLKKFKTQKELMDLPLVYPELVTPLWAWERLVDWGEASPIFQSRVQAEFPEEGTDTLIPLNVVERALTKEFDEEKWELRPRNNVIGIDVARFGSDTTVFTAMDNEKMLELDWHSGKNLMETCGKAINIFDNMGFEKEFDKFVVDDTGLGGGVTDRLVELGYIVQPINFGSSSSEPEAYVNIKAEIMWHLRDLFMKGEISILDVGKLVAELPTMRYDYNSRSQLAIVSKAQMKKDGLQSPDFADSLALAVWGIRSSGFGSGMDVSGGVGKTVGGNLFEKSF